MNLSTHFHAYVLSLKGWEDRHERFTKRAFDLGVYGYEVLWGVDGDKIGKPNWWRPNARKWACNLAHLNALHAGIMADGDKPILIFEDDAHLRENFLAGIEATVRFFERTPDATVLYLGGRKHGKGHMVDPLIEQGVKVGGAWAYAVAPKHAPVISGYLMNLPPNGRPRRFANDTKMMIRSAAENHAAIVPPCVGHHGGPSILLKRNRKPINVGVAFRTSNTSSVAPSPVQRCPCEGSSKGSEG